jgi:hypothetical protein
VVLFLKKKNQKDFYVLAAFSGACLPGLRLG